MDNAVELSVIVPVYNAKKTISVLFSSLLSQTYDKGDFEVIFVDNGSTDESLEMLNDFALTSGLRVVVTVEAEIPGSYAARNKGISMSQGGLLVFTDADCIPSAEWLSILYDSWVKTNPENILVGEVVLVAQDEQNTTAVELFEMVHGFKQKDNIEKKGYGVTANIAVARSFFDVVGVFNQTLKSKGDYDWCRRALAAGGELLYLERALVMHPARRSLSDLCVKVRRVVGGQRDISGAKAAGDSKPGIRNLIVRFFGSFFFIVRDAELDSWFDRLRVIFVTIFVVCVICLEKLRLQFGGESERR